jgi:hypothetical protein
MTCSLSARGKDFDVETFLARTRLPFKDAHFWIRKTPIYNTKRRHHDSGFSEWVSRDKWDNLRSAVAEVLKFLKVNRKELLKLKHTKGVKDLMLDFAFDSRLGTKNVAMQGEYLPAELLRLAGELDIGIGLSIYPPFIESKAKKRKTVRTAACMLAKKGFKQWLQKQGKQKIRKAKRKLTARRA